MCREIAVDKVVNIDGVVQSLSANKKSAIRYSKNKLMSLSNSWLKILIILKHKTNHRNIK